MTTQRFSARLLRNVVVDFTESLEAAIEDWRELER
jgi:hypothetical protein